MKYEIEIILIVQHNLQQLLQIRPGPNAKKTDVITFFLLYEPQSTVLSVHSFVGGRFNGQKTVIEQFIFIIFCQISFHNFGLKQMKAIRKLLNRSQKRMKKY